MKPHKWAKEIKAWADGAEIQFKDSNDTNEWFDTKEPTWEILDFLEYRIKPQEQQSCCCCKQTCSAPKEPQYLYAYKDTIDVNGNSTTLVKISTVKLNIDRYIGKIKLEE